MEKTTFLILFVLWVLLFSIKGPILNALHKNNTLLGVSQKGANYFFVFLFIVLIIAGMLFTVNAKSQFANVSQGFEQVRNPPENAKPHRFFNIDFDLIFPKGND
jgi:amino acid transporter